MGKIRIAHSYINQSADLVEADQPVQTGNGYAGGNCRYPELDDFLPASASAFAIVVTDSETENEVSVEGKKRDSVGMR